MVRRGGPGQRGIGSRNHSCHRAGPGRISIEKGILVMLMLIGGWREAVGTEHIVAITHEALVGSVARPGGASTGRARGKTGTRYAGFAA